MLLIKNKWFRLLAGILETTNLISLKLLFKKPSKFRLYSGTAFRHYASLVGQDKWISKSIFDIFPNLQGIRVTLEHLPGEGIESSLEEIAYLALIAKSKSPEAIFEIGTFKGRTALNFALNSPDDCVVHTLDLPPSPQQQAIDKASSGDQRIINISEPDLNYKDKDVAYKIKQLYSDSMEFDFSPYHGSIDIVFIDGAHHYEAVKSDTENALKLIKSDGLIIWHDFAMYGDYNDVTRAVLDCIPKNDVVQIGSTSLAIYKQNDCKKAKG